MTTFKNSVNAFGNSAGDDMSKHITQWKGRGVVAKGKIQNYPGEVANISTGNRRLAKAKHGAGSGGTAFCGKNAFTKGKK